MPADAEDTDGEGAPQGLSWSWELDLGALIDSLDAVPGTVSSVAPSPDAPFPGRPFPGRPFPGRPFPGRSFPGRSFLRCTGLS